MSWRIEQLSEGVTLYCGDCREILPTLAFNSNVVVCSDPPYGIAHVRSGGGRQGGASSSSFRRHANETIVGDESPFDPQHLLSFRELLLWGADHYRRRIPEGGRFLAWDKLAGASLKDSFSDIEFAWHSERGAARRITYLWKGILQDGEKQEQRAHPTQKPVEVMVWSIGQLSTKSAIILDPYMGSGTTGVACVRLGRRFIGIEIEPKYFDIACRRIADELKRPRLDLAPAPAPAEQMPLGLGGEA